MIFFVCRVIVRVFNTTFNNILAISWQRKTGGPGENHRTGKGYVALRSLCSGGADQPK
jgi:hypothetical protein